MQELVTGVIVVVACVSVGRHLVRSWTAGESGCGAGCGKCSAAPAVENPVPGRISLL